MAAYVMAMPAVLTGMAAGTIAMAAMIADMAAVIVAIATTIADIAAGGVGMAWVAVAMAVLATQRSSRSKSHPMAEFAGRDRPA
jgi:hypothetical protein